MKMIRDKNGRVDSVIVRKSKFPNQDKINNLKNLLIKDTQCIDVFESPVNNNTVRIRLAYKD